jgi:hypothetical protein|tara:strand:+ start:760 stop:951 length:192 start_codon:yes stop_codon:yes gene_type:complete
MVSRGKALWIRAVRGLNVVDEAREAFQQMMKMAILFGGMAIFYIWIESKILKKWKKRKRKGNR